MATLKDIAKRADVSFQAVSSALNGHGNSRISQEKLELILKVAKELGYHRDIVASGLRTKRTQTIGVIFPGMIDTYYAELMHSMLEKLIDEKYTALFSFAIHGEKEYVTKLTNELFARRIDGLITYMPPSVIPEGKVPTLYIPSGASRRFEGVNTCAIAFDQAIPQALKYLKQMGHRDIGYIGSIYDDRYKNFVSSIKEEKLNICEEWLYHGWGIAETGELGAMKILSAKKRPTAILAFNDTTAISVMNTFHRMGFRVPEDFSVIGFDDISEARYSFPRLTTFNTKISETAKLLIESIISMIRTPKNEKISESIIPELIIRDSCRKIGG